MIKITVDTTELKVATSNLSKAPQWLPRTVNLELGLLGRRVVPIMQAELDKHHYTGTLSNSVKSYMDTTLSQVSIGPDAKRGNYDAGLISQMGTIPIGNLPWQPIQQWGEARGLTPKQIRGAWLKIRARGVSSHPFLNETMQRSDFQFELESTANRIGQKLAAQTFINGNATGAALVGGATIG